jgi:ribosomal protein S18 acetylase RimI-like enzyme
MESDSLALRAATAGDLDAIVAPHTASRLTYYRAGQWGQGVGGALHAALVRYLRENAFSAGRLAAWERNERAQAFYARQGRLPDGHREPGPAGSQFVRLRLDAGRAADRPVDHDARGA